MLRSFEKDHARRANGDGWMSFNPRHLHSYAVICSITPGRYFSNTFNLSSGQFVETLEDILMAWVKTDQQGQQSFQHCKPQKRSFQVFKENYNESDSIIYIHCNGFIRTHSKNCTFCWKCREIFTVRIQGSGFHLQRDKISFWVLLKYWLRNI